MKKIFLGITLLCVSSPLYAFSAAVYGVAGGAALGGIVGLIHYKKAEKEFKLNPKKNANKASPKWYQYICLYAGFGALIGYKVGDIFDYKSTIHKKYPSVTNLKECGICWELYNNSKHPVILQCSGTHDSQGNWIRGDTPHVCCDACLKFIKNNPCPYCRGQIYQFIHC